MKFGFRMPSLKRRIAARTSVKRFIRHNMGVKMPRGTGFLTNPKKALYNKIYNKTSFGIDSFIKAPAKTELKTKEIEIKLQASDEGVVLCPKCNKELGIHYKTLPTIKHLHCSSCGFDLEFNRYTPNPNLP